MKRDLGARLIAGDACTWCGHAPHVGRCDGCPCRSHDRPEPATWTEPGGLSIWERSRQAPTTDAARALAERARGGK